MKKHYGWTVRGILGLPFALVGLVFIPAGLILNTANPGRNARIVFWIFEAMGAAFFLIGTGFLSGVLRRRHLMRRAYNGGNAVTARVTDIRAQNNVSINGQHPIVLDCEYRGNVYQSRYLYRNIPERGSEITVYIDRIDERIGFVDI